VIIADSSYVLFGTSTMFHLSSLAKGNQPIIVSSSASPDIRDDGRIAEGNAIL
jgi:hypothetical protein